MPLPGTPLYYEWKSQVGLDSVDWNKFLYYQIVPFVSEIDEQILRKYLKRAVLGFYLRPRILLGLVRELKTAHQVKVVWKRARMILFGKVSAKEKREQTPDLTPTSPPEQPPAAAPVERDAPVSVPS